MATVAAPTFFGAQRIGSNDYIDGGLGANNPTLLMLREAKKRWNVDPDELGLCLSIGSGSIGNHIELSKASGYSYLPTLASMLTTTETENTEAIVASMFQDVRPTGAGMLGGSLVIPR